MVTSADRPPVPASIISLIDLIAAKSHPPTPADRLAILDAMAAAQFNPTKRLARDWVKFGYPIVGSAYPGQPGRIIQASDLLDSLEAHTAKHIDDKGWRQGTTPTQYLASLRVAIRQASTLRVGTNEGAPKAATLTLVTALVHTAPDIRQMPGRQIFVVYNAQRDYLQTGYSVEGHAVHKLLSGWQPFYIL